MMHIPTNWKAFGLGVSLLATDAVLPKVSAAEIADIKSGSPHAEANPFGGISPETARTAVNVVGGLYVATSLAAGIVALFETFGNKQKPNAK